MNNEHHISDERLNTYIDGELDAEEAGQMLETLRQSPSLSQKVCELRQVNDLVRHAYSETSLPGLHAKPKSQGRPYLQSMAAVLMLTVGATGGWLAHGTQSPAAGNVHAGATQQRPQNVILHISTDDPIKISDALDRAELMLTRNKEKGQPFRLEIVANDDGLNLLRARYSSYPERTEELIENYDNVNIMACARTLKAIKDRGGDVELLPNVSTTESALEHVVDRLQDGWTYIRV